MRSHLPRQSTPTRLLAGLDIQLSAEHLQSIQFRNGEYSFDSGIGEYRLPLSRQDAKDIVSSAFPSLSLRFVQMLAHVLSNQCWIT